MGCDILMQFATTVLLEKTAGFSFGPHLKG